MTANSSPALENPERVSPLWYGVGLALAALLLWLFLKDADWARVFDAFSQIAPLPAIAALTGHALAVVVAAWRWRALLKPLDNRVSFASAWRSYGVGQTLVTLLPGRAGEIARPWLLSRETGIPFSSIFAAVLVERVVDLTATLVFLATPLLFASVLADAGQHPFIGSLQIAALVAGSLVAIVLLTIVIGSINTGFVLACVRFLARPLPHGIGSRLSGAAESFFGYFRSLLAANVLGTVLLATAVYWSLFALNAWLMADAFNLRLDLPACAFFVAVFALGSLVPTPAGAGSVHGVTILLIAGLWGRNYDITVAFAIVNHLAFNLPLVSVGIFYLLRGIRVRPGTVAR